MAYVSEDRKTLGLNLLDDIKTATVQAKWSKVSTRGVIDKHKVFVAAEDYRKRLRTKTPSVNEGVDKLSGGNQQKVVLSKWMFTDSDLLILDEPTRGIDVGAKYEIYEVIFELARQGKGVIVDLLRAARGHRHLRPHLHGVRGAGHRRRPGRGSHPGITDEDHDIRTSEDHSMSKMKEFRQGVFGNADVRQYGMVFSLIAIIVLFFFTTDGVVLSSVNLINVVSQYSYILILAIGMVMVIIAGHIDLSVGSVAAFVGIVVAKTMADWGIAWPLGIIVGIVAGILVGMWQGFWVSRVMVPAFIVTLAGMLIFRGLNQVIGKSETVPVPEGFKVIGRGYIPQVGPDLILGNGSRVVNTPTLILGIVAVLALVWLEFRKRAKAKSVGDEVPPLWASAIKLLLLGLVIMFFAFKFATGNKGTGFPVSGLILLVLVFIYSFIMGNTTFGRHIYAVGGNKRAAALSGVNVPRVNFLVMANMSMLAAVAGMVYLARAGAAGPAGRRGLGARRDRRRVHRRSGRHRRCRDRGRVDGRWPGHGLPQQRAVPHGCRAVLGVGHQGPGPPRRRRLRPPEQADGSPAAVPIPEST